MTSVAICALTLQRPHGLDALLKSLAALRDPGTEHHVKVVVVDNDPDGSARPIVDRWRDRMPWELVYAIEPRRGIPFGRNTAVRMAGDVDFVAFLDDDEIADEGWLDELLRVQRRTGADVVTGTVLPQFEHQPPAWALEGEFFERPRFPTGTRLTYARTSNVLIGPTSSRPAIRLRSTRRWVSTAGTTPTSSIVPTCRDTSSCGRTTRSCTSSSPRRGSTPKWLIRREYRRGNTLSLCLRDLQDSWWRRIRRTGLGLLNIGRGVGEGLLGLVRGRAAVIGGARRVCFGAGLLTGLVGLRFDEYRTIHGS